MFGATVLALTAAAVVGVALAGQKDKAANPWLQPPSFDAEGGPGSITVTDATEGDPVVTARWHLDESGQLALAAGPTDVVGPKGEVTIVDLEAGTWVVATESTIAWATTVTPAPTLDLMSFNVRYDNPDDDPNWDARVGPILTMLGERRPDVIGTQEALHHQVLDLAAGLPDHAWVGVGRDDGVTAGEFAAVFYRSSEFRLVDDGTFWLSETPDVPSRGWDAALPRVVTWVELQRIGQKDTFFVFNTHFDHEGVTAREESAALLAERVSTIAAGRPAFVMGDLNVLPSSPVLDPILATMDDSRTSAQVTDTVGSFNAFVAPTGFWSIDYVFHDHGRATVFETVDDDYGVSFISDHFPVVATIECAACG